MPLISGGATGSGSIATLYDSGQLAGAAASIDTGANGIAATSAVLDVLLVTRTTEAAFQSSVVITVNNDTGAKYDRETVFGANVTAGAVNSLGQTGWLVTCAGASSPAGEASAIRIWVPNYAGTTLQKVASATSAYADTTAAQAVSLISALNFRDTAAISRLKVAAGSGNLVAGSRLIIFGYGVA